VKGFGWAEKDFHKGFNIPRPNLPNQTFAQGSHVRRRTKGSVVKLMVAGVRASGVRAMVEQK